MQPIVAAMLEEDGIYITGNSDQPERAMPLFVRGGKVYSMRTDEALDPNRFPPDATFSGPYWAKPAGVRPEEQMPIDILLKLAAKSLPPKYVIMLEASPDGLCVILEYHNDQNVVAFMMDTAMSIKDQIKTAQAKAIECPNGLSPSQIDQYPGAHPML